MYRFGDFELNGDARELRRATEPVHLEPQAFDLLAYLVEHRDRVISKIELMDEVWGHQFLSESNLTTRVKEIRHALGDDGRQQHTIKNVRGRGYRFVAAVDTNAPLPTRSRLGNARLFGREREAAAIANALGESPVVTVVGPGGVGKTTVAIGTAHEVSTRYTDGTHVVELAALANNEHALPTVARALGVVFDAERPESAINSIGQLDALVVLDNCEHVCDTVSELIQRILNVVGRRIHVLITSQIRLGLSEEVVITLQPLELREATELFRARARAAAPDWDRSAIADDRVEALVAALDRLPLTVEMAAARLGAMTFDDLERSIGERAPLLHMTHRTPARRHRSLESLVTWSTDLLNEQERETFTRFAVFAHDVGISDITAILDPEAQGRVRFDLAALADHSLLVANVQASRTRYAMLTTMRTVAAGWLESSPAAEALRARHAEHFANALNDIDDMLRTPHELDGRRRLDEIIAEVRVAYRWAQRNRPELASQICGSLFLATNSSLWFEPSTWSQDLLTARTPDEGQHLLGAHLTAASAAAHRGQLRVAREHAAIVADNEQNEGRPRAIALEVLADVALYEGDLAAAQQHAEALLQLGERLGDAHASAFGVVDIALARTYGDDALGALMVLDANRLDALAPSDQAWLEYARGDALSALGDASATEAFDEAIRLGRTVDNQFVVSVAHTSLAIERARVGDVERAFETFAVSLRDSLRHGNLTHAVTACRNLVSLLADVGDDHAATVLAGSMANGALRVSYGAEASGLSDVLSKIEQRIGTIQFAAWFDQGRTLDLQSAVPRAAEFAERHRNAGSEDPHTAHK